MALPIKFDHFSNKQKIVLLVCGAIIFLGVGVGLTMPKKLPLPSSIPPVKRIPAPTATPTPIPASFKFSPPAAILKAGETLTIILTLDSGAFAVDAVDAILDYDPAFFKATKITSGKILAQYPIKQFDNVEGKVQLSAAATIKNGEIASFSGQGKYGTITFQALKATSPGGAKISWDTNSVVASAGKNILDLEKSTAGEYAIAQ